MSKEKKMRFPENIDVQSREKKGYKGFYQIVLKRLVDIFVSLVALIILSPLFLILICFKLFVNTKYLIHNILSIFNYITN